jgi:plasmid stabilization system protein ParE
MWSEPSLADFNVQLLYIAHESPQNATLVVDRIESSVESLQHIPTGKVGRVHGTYEKIIPKTSLIIVYRVIAENRIEIARLIHTARNWKGETYSD